MIADGLKIELGIMVAAWRQCASSLGGARHGKAVQ